MAKPSDMPGTPTGNISPAPPAAAFSPPWLKLTGTDRLVSCLNFAGTVPASAWPGLLESCRDDELLRPVLVREWARKDPSGFWNWICGRKDLALITEAGAQIFESWAAIDPKAALAGVARIGSVKIRSPLVSKIFDSALDHDPAQGLKLLEASRVWGLQLKNSWIDREPSLALDRIWPLPASVPNREQMLSHALTAVSEKDPSAAISWIHTNGPDAPQEPVERALRTAATREPESAFKALSTFSNSKVRESLLHSAISGAFEKLSALEVIQLVRANAGEAGLQAVLPHILSTASEKEPALAASHWSEIPDTRRTPFLASELAGNYAKTDWSAASSWVGELDDPAFRRQSWQQIIWALPPGETAAFAQRIADMPEGELSDQLLRSVRNALTKNLGLAASEEWIASLPPTHAEWVKALKD